MLALKNKHPRDDNILFIPDGHIYQINGKPPPKMSVTSVAHKFFPEFDADGIINKIFSKKNRTDKYIGMTKEQVKESWKKNGEEAAALGTTMHAQIEDFLNGIEIKERTPEFCQFLDFWAEFQRNCPNLKPFRTEWLIYDEITGVPGCIDFCVEDENGNLMILDWKRSKEIKESNEWQKGFGPCAHLDDCNYNHYCLQLNIYEWILTHNYGKKIIGRFLVIFHPNQEKYKMMWVPLMQDVVAKIMGSMN